MSEPVDTPVDEGPRTVTLPGDLKIVVKSPTEEQVAVLIKASRAAQRNLEIAGIPAVDIFFRVLTALLVNPDEDVDRIDDALIMGTIKIRDLATKVLGYEMNDDAAKPAKRTRTTRRR